MRHIIALFAVTLLLAGCETKTEPAKKPAPKTTSATPTTNPVILPATLFLTTAPADAKDVKEIKPTLKAGDKVTLTGRIGGSKTPFVEGRAIFTLIDTHLPACGEGADKDECETPWDFCCEPRDQVTANTATIQVVNAEGQPLKTNLKGANGLKELTKVTVVGTVTLAETGNLLVKADGIYIVQ